MLNKKHKYLQIALNSTLEEAHQIINQIPLDYRIIIEVGTPLIKNYGAKAIRNIRVWWKQRMIFGSSLASSAWAPQDALSRPSSWWVNLTLSKQKKFFLPKTKSQKLDSSAFSPYIVADLKCMDRGEREVDIAYQEGANAAVALGHAPIETLNSFIQRCEDCNLDAMIDMMNVEFPLEILRKLKKLPKVVILHRGVDEESFNPEKEIPYHEIQRIKNEYDIMLAIAGGDDFQEVQRAIFNDADIVVVWKSFYQKTSDTAELVNKFLKEIR